MHVTIETILHSDHRPEAGKTIGDWVWSDDGESLTLRVSRTGDWRQDMCIAYHELLEALECKYRGITAEQVDAFDGPWKEHDGLEEPGDDPQAPYYDAHQHAMVAEYHIANCLGVHWPTYEKAVDALFE